MQNQNEDRNGSTATVVCGNPAYKGPPKKRWFQVEIVALPGTELGILNDTFGGTLTLTSRRQGEPWPFGWKPTGGINTIAEGCRIYAIVSDDVEKSEGASVAETPNTKAE